MIPGYPGGSTLTLTPRSWYSWDFHVAKDGEQLALIDRHWVRENAVFAVNGTTYTVRRTSMLRGTFVLERSGTIMAEARKTSAFRRAFDVSVGVERFRLQAESSFRRKFVLLEGGVPVGGVEPVSMFRRSAIARFPVKLPLEVQLFMVFLVLLLWKRQQDAAAAS